MTDFFDRAIELHAARTGDHPVNWSTHPRNPSNHDAANTSDDSLTMEVDHADE